MNKAIDLDLQLARHTHPPVMYQRAAYWQPKGNDRLVELY
jgi:hypothetical protein